MQTIDPEYDEVKMIAYRYHDEPTMGEHDGTVTIHLHSNEGLVHIVKDLTEAEYCFEVDQEHELPPIIRVTGKVPQI